MTINLIPYGQLPNGNFGINLDNITGKPIASALEVKDTLPAVGDPNNFVGRLVFAKDTTTTYVFIDTPVSFWDPLEGIPADVGAVGGNPPTVPVPPLGSLFWDTDTEVLFVWDGLQWQAAGGRYATIIVEKRYVGDNFLTTYFLGTISNPLPIHVEAFLQGVRQINNSTDTVSPDYSVVGNNIVFVTPPAAGVEIFLRSMETVQIAQTAEAFDIYHTVGSPPSLTNNCSGSGDYCINTGRTDIQPEATFVSIDGAVQAQGVDYTFTQADTTIVTAFKDFAAATEARIQTTVAHGITIPGSVVELRGFSEAEGDGASYSVSSIFSPTEFRIPCLATEFVAALTPDPIGFFTPSFITNEVVFSPDPFLGGENVYIKMFKSLITGPITGEANTLAKIPAAIGQDITGTKAGDVLQVKGIAAGTNVTVTDVGNDLVIASSTGSTFEARAGVNVNYHAVSPTESYIGVSSTLLFPVTVDMVTAVSTPYTGPGDPNWRGRRIIIKDEGGLASVNNITIIGPTGALFENQPSYTINVNFGSVSLVFDDTNWWIVAEYP